ARSDFTLEVNFATKEINTRASHPVQIVFGSVTGTVILNGKFTEKGVIYGTSQVKLTDTLHATKPNEELTSDGSLTGLIGEKGAVGAFISDGALDDAGIYVGGFVARNPNACINDPFSGYCDDEDSIRTRADMCLDNMPRMFKGVNLCETVVAEICSRGSSDSAINPFHAICGIDSTYDDSRRLSCTNNRDGYSGSSCADLIMNICITDDGDDLFKDICAGTYDKERQARCEGESIDFGTCRSIIAPLCRNEPFNTAAGVGEAKFDCANSGVYANTRRGRIVLCSDDAERTTNLLCTQPGVAAITTPCADDPFDIKCDDYATQYGDARVTRLSTCRGSRTARATVNCTGAALMVCVTDNKLLDTICAG
ncbi:MAG: hypothetical protein K8953_06325, partial [Proteobacteria bacterium]|nr:hypothetical protein [Pseudomonadota bacterium]